MLEGEDGVTRGDTVIVLQGTYRGIRGEIIDFTRHGGLLVDLGVDSDCACVVEFHPMEVDEYERWAA